MHSNEFMSRANFTEYSSQDELEFISSFCTEESSQANLPATCRLVIRMTPLQWGATHSMIRCKTMCEQGVRKNGRHIKKKQQNNNKQNTKATTNNN